MTFPLPSNFTFLAVDWYDESSNYVSSVDITADVKAIPLFTDVGTESINSARIVLRSLDGNYITQGNVIDNFDRIQIRCTDLSGNTYNRFFEIVDIIPSASGTDGTLLTLECLGIEYHTQQILFSKPYYFANAFDVAKDIGDIYNESRGSRQPSLGNHVSDWNVLEGTGNALPKWTANNFEYGLNEDTIYNRWMDLINKMSSSVSAGGAGLRPFELSFLAVIKDGIVMRLRNTGDNTPTVTIKNAKVTNPLTVGEQESEISNPTGSVVGSWGSVDHGSLPVEFSKYDSQLIQFAFRPEWVSGITGGYPVDARVKVTASDGTEQHYRSKIDGNTATPPGPTAGTQDTDANWEQISMKDEFGDNLTYSLWTDDKFALWRNNGSDPTGNNAGQGMWDFNLVIWDDVFFRTWVDARASGNSDLDSLADSSGDGYSFTTSRDDFPQGFRVLVDSDSPTGDLANFANMVAEYDGSVWHKKYSFDSSNDKSQIAVIDEGRLYEYQHSTTSWTDISGDDYANDCFHQYSDIANVAGVDLVNGTPRSDITDAITYPEITHTTGQSFSKNNNSAVEITFTHGSIVNAALDASHS